MKTPTEFYHKITHNSFCDSTPIHTIPTIPTIYIHVQYTYVSLHRPTCAHGLHYSGGCWVFINERE